MNFTVSDTTSLNDVVLVLVMLMIDSFLVLPASSSYSSNNSVSGNLQLDVLAVAHVIV